MKSIILCSVLILTSAGIALGGDPGTFDFLRLPVGARAAALNGSFVSMKNDPNGIFANPASLTTIQRRTLSIGYTKHLLDINGGNASYTQYLNGIGHIGAGMIVMDYGSFDMTDESMNRTGTFGARDLALLVGGALPVAEFTSAGVNLKFIHSTIASYNSSALAVDIGVFYEIPSEQITIGASVLNLGRQLSPFVNQRESLPLDVKVGITKKPLHLPVHLNLNFHKLNESHDSILETFSNFTFGVELLMSESLQLRLGYSNEQRKELKLGSSSGLAGFAAGGGLHLQDYTVDYAFNSYGKIGGIHRISVGISL
ncbi:MAG: type IX secretion system protein PorQ [Ignavibacteria bacterium]|nr:type IX secretion system protein PorQ [Ignavibacteria bacterium]